ASRFYIGDDGQNRARTTLVLVVDPIPLQILLGTISWDPIEKIWPLGLAVGPENRPRELVRPGFTLVLSSGVVLLAIRDTEGADVDVDDDKDIRDALRRIDAKETRPARYEIITRARLGTNRQPILTTHAPQLELSLTFKKNFFRPGQSAVVDACMAGRDVMAVMPTGHGKSLCYQIAAYCLPGLTVVIEPLLSLINDQVLSMNSLGVAAATINSTQSRDIDQEPIFDALRKLQPHGGLKLLYITPEMMLRSTELRQILQNLRDVGLFARIVVDECHCISQWGHDFRSDYKRLSLLRTFYNQVPIAALTATATPSVMQECIDILRLKTPYILRLSSNRRNIIYSVRRKNGTSLHDLAGLINQKFPGKCGLFYLRTIEECKATAEKLQHLLPWTTVSPYHAKLKSTKRAALMRVRNKRDSHEFSSRASRTLNSELVTVTVIYSMRPTNITMICPHVDKPRRSFAMSPLVPARRGAALASAAASRLSRPPVRPSRYGGPPRLDGAASFGRPGSLRAGGVVRRLASSAV
ncbi:hypothetical protein THAOC_37656, partial [Thalassiosira oceanica]